MFTSTITLAIPRAYSLIILTSVINWMILFWQMIAVGKARKQYEVPYPTLYENKHPSPFNCIQRAHQASLEWNQGFIMFLFISGISTPLLSTAAGMIYNIGRVYYTKGYHKGNPHHGLWGLYGLFYLLGGSIYTAIQIIRQS